MPESQGRGGETSAGYHFHSKYQQCPRSWYIRYYLGLEPIVQGRALPFGSAIHESLKAFCVKPSDPGPGFLHYTFIAELEARRADYQEDAEYQEDLQTRGPNILATWYMEIGSSFHNHYRVVEAEQVWEVPLYDGSSITVRIDRIIHEFSTSSNYVIETKTSSWSATATAEIVADSDQITTYQLACERVRPDLRIQGTIPEVLYNKGSVYKAIWGEVIYRSQAELQDWEDQLVGLSREISDKVASVNDVPVGQLFPRIAVCCNPYTKKCENPFICRNLPAPGELPHGYRRRDRDSGVQELQRGVPSEHRVSDGGVRNPDQHQVEADAEAQTPKHLAEGAI